MCFWYCILFIAKTIKCNYYKFISICMRKTIDDNNIKYYTNVKRILGKSFPINDTEYVVNIQILLGV